eukprot:TRINITY_DN16721_c0_g1_i1.p1 TRINITY_DN16721_c0_g1~~TRINITY_DN16721_c0_g1_i1.p1  ORF type:complete len:324 (-),score=30.86 TRINITY_DN16721_c0_g1_i1:345-1253(-)
MLDNLSGTNSNYCAQISAKEANIGSINCYMFMGASIAFLLRVLWAGFELLALMYCCGWGVSEDKGVPEDSPGPLMLGARLMLLHVFPIVVCASAAWISEDVGMWSHFYKIALYADASIYTVLLVLTMGNEQAKNDVFKKLTSIRLLKLLTTPLETLVVIQGTFGRGFTYRQRPTFNDVPVRSDASPKMQPVAGRSAGLREEQMVDSSSAVNMSLVQCIWLITIVLGCVSVLQWRWQEPQSLARDIGAWLFTSYGAGSLITVTYYYVNADGLAQGAYAFNHLQPELDPPDAATLLGSPRPGLR